MTLIELMVVVALIAIGVGLVAWGFGSQRPRQRLMGAATELQALIHSARQNAMATGRRTVVVFFPQFQTGEGTGRVIVVEDSLDQSFFVDQLDDLDPEKTGAISLGGDQAGGVLDHMDLPPSVTFGPPGGQGAGSRTPAPYNIPLDAACTFCTGVDGRGAIAFDDAGHATFWDVNSRSPLGAGYENGASVSLIADDLSEMQTLVISAATGTTQALSLVVP